MRDAIKDLEKKQVAGYILDLRSNPGGLLFSSVEIAQMGSMTVRLSQQLIGRGKKTLKSLTTIH